MANSPKQSVQLSRFDFYSGSQITVWFGNILIDDISSIQWSRSQNKTPIYGYASQLFDVVANGIVLIQGTFTVNFRQQGYIPAVVSEIKKLYKVFGPDSSEAQAQNEDPWPVVQNLISTHLRNGTFGPQTAEEIQELGNNPNFLDLAKQYESLIWDSGYGPTPVQYPSDVQQAKDIPDGFNILISYGVPQNSDAKTMNDVMQSTTRTLNGVHIIGESQIIAVGGDAIQEQYSFIARNTDESVNN